MPSCGFAIGGAIWRAPGEEEAPAEWGTLVQIAPPMSSMFSKTKQSVNSEVQ